MYYYYTNRNTLPLFAAERICRIILVDWQIVIREAHEDLMRIFNVAAIFVMLICAVPTHASYTGLIIIPTADILPKYEYVVQPELDGAISSFENDTRLINTQYGIADRFEAGIDFDFSPGASSRFVLNAKYMPLKSEKIGLAGAAGIYNCASGTGTCPYVVITKAFQPLRFHSGVMDVNNSLRWFAGVDHYINDRYTLMAEFTSGDDNFTGLGVTYKVNNNSSVLIGALFPNAGGDLQYSLQIDFTGLYHR